MDELKLKKKKLQIMKMDTAIMEYEVKIQERMEDIKRIEREIEHCRQNKEELLKEIE